MKMETSILISIHTGIPRIKLNSPRQSAIFRHFQNQEYRSAISKLPIYNSNSKERERERERERESREQRAESREQRAESREREREREMFRRNN